MEDNSKREQAQLGQALMQTLIRVSALEKVMLDKKLFTDQELADALAYVVSDVLKTAKDLGVAINFQEPK